MSLANKTIPIAIVYLSDDREPPVSATIFGGTIVQGGVGIRLSDLGSESFFWRVR